MDLYESEIIKTNLSSTTMIIQICYNFALFTDAGKPDELVDDIACKMADNTSPCVCEIRCCSLPRHQLFHSDRRRDVLFQCVKKVGQKATVVFLVAHPATAVVTFRTHTVEGIFQDSLTKCQMKQNRNCISLRYLI